MKTLRKDGEYIRVPDTTQKEISKLNTMIDSGWFFAPKSDWKEWKSTFEKPKKEKKEKKSKK